MNPLYGHLLLNELPLIGGVGALLLLGWGLYRRSPDVTVAALVGFVLVGIGGILAYTSGNTASMQVTDPATKALVQMHREAAIVSLVGLEGAASVAVCALFCWWTTRRYPMFAVIATLILGIAASILVVHAAELGGQVNHRELRPRAVATR